MSPHVWVQDDEDDPEIGLMVNFDEEPTPESIEVFKELARWIRDEHRAGRDVFKGQPTVRLTEAEAAEPGDIQMARIQRLRRRAGLDQ